MTTLQEYLNQKYPTKEEREKVEEIDFYELRRSQYPDLRCHGTLDLSDYVNLKRIQLEDSGVSEVILGEKPNLTFFGSSYTCLKSLDFLETLSHPEKLKDLYISGNPFPKTDIAFFSKFKNIKVLKIGLAGRFSKNKSGFYGSFESWKDLNELKSICIEATDVDRGLEYLPFMGRRCISEVGPRGTDAKCITIQNELRPFDYDLGAWQLAHPEKMLISHPEYFTQENSRDQWINALSNKITQSQQELVQIKEQEAGKTKKISRLESQISELTKVKEVISQSTQTDPITEPTSSHPWYQEVIERLKKTFTTETREQGIQTDLSSQDYEQQKKEIKELREQISKLTVKK